MNERDIKIGESFIPFLDKNCDEQILVVESSGSSSSPFLYNIKDKKADYVGYNFREYNKTVSPDLKQDRFISEGVYVYRYKNNKLVEHNLYEKKELPIKCIEKELVSSLGLGFLVMHALYNIEPLEEKDIVELEKNLKIEESLNKNHKEVKLSYDGVEIEIDYNPIESERHIAEDFKVLEKENIKTIIKEKFLPWFKTEEIKDSDDDKIIEGLKITEITYSYHRIVAQYSPTNQDDYFGEFQFTFESCSEYTKDMLQAVVMEVYVNNGKVVKVSGYDV